MMENQYNKTDYLTILVSRIISNIKSSITGISICLFLIIIFEFYANFEFLLGNSTIPREGMIYNIIFSYLIYFSCSFIFFIFTKGNTISVIYLIVSFFIINSLISLHLYS